MRCILRRSFETVLFTIGPEKFFFNCVKPFLNFFYNFGEYEYSKRSKTELYFQTVFLKLRFNNELFFVGLFPWFDKSRTSTKNEFSILM